MTRSTWNIARLEWSATARIRWISVAVASVWTLLVLIQEPTYFVRAGIDLGPDGALWAGWITGTFGAAMALPSLRQRLDPVIRWTRQPQALSAGVSLAWSLHFLLIAISTVGLQALWDAFGNLDRSSGLRARAAAQSGLLVCWALAMPALAVLGGRFSGAIACWLLFWCGGLAFGVPFPLETFLTIHPSWNVLVLWGAAASASLALVLYQFDALSDSR